MTGLLRICAAQLLLLGLLAPDHLLAQQTTADVIVYGGTPGGIAAALAASRAGHDVLLVEPYRRVGGLTTNGLSHTDFRTYEGLSGTFLEFANRVHDYYRQRYGENSTQVADCRRGTNGEPHVNQIVFEQMLNEQSSIEVLTSHQLADVAVSGGLDDGEPSRIESATFLHSDGNPLSVHAKIFIDATYEGDLMAAASVPYAVGRESRAQYGESLAPEEADGQVQGYNFRLVVTRDSNNRVQPEAPAEYKREDYLPLVELLKSGRLESVFCERTGGIYKAHLPALPNGKHDVNDVSRGLVRLSMPDLSDGWPDGDAETRRQIFQAHVRHNIGMLYFLQNDQAVPSRYQMDARQYGWCRDEFQDNGHIPEQLYVREARRMIGQRVFTEQDTANAEGDVRARLHVDAIAIGDYSHNCHGTDHEGPRFGGRHVGEFYKGTTPYQIPYGTLIPQRCENLLVPVACSSSHVGFCALRLEPIWMSLGQAAGTAAHLAITGDIAVQDVPVKRLQQLLHADGCATIYAGDVPPNSDNFQAVQWWGTRGGLHGLVAASGKSRQRGAHITSQYYEKYPGHDVELETPLDDELRQRWMKLAAAHALAATALESTATRGEFIRAAYKEFQQLANGHTKPIRHSPR